MFHRLASPWVKLSTRVSLLEPRPRGPAISRGSLRLQIIQHLLDDRLQRGEVSDDDVPHLGIVDDLVAVAKNVADVSYPAPGNLRMLCLEVVWHMAGGFRDDLDAALDGAPHHGHRHVVVKRLAGGKAFNVPDRGQDILEARGRVEERHQKTSMASASTRARIRGRIFHGAVEISTGRPRTSARSCS